MHVRGNPKTKKQVILALAKGEEVYAFQPGPFGFSAGRTTLEGPHEFHRWYATAMVDEYGKVLDILGDNGKSVIHAMQRKLAREESLPCQS